MARNCTNCGYARGYTSCDWPSGPEDCVQCGSLQVARDADKYDEDLNWVSLHHQQGYVTVARWEDMVSDEVDCPNWWPIQRDEDVHIAERFGDLSIDDITNHITGKLIVMEKYRLMPQGAFIREVVKDTLVELATR